jgi:hypothetical protein
MRSLKKGVISVGKYTLTKGLWYLVECKSGASYIFRFIGLDGNILVKDLCYCITDRTYGDDNLPGVCRVQHILDIREVGGSIVKNYFGI